MGEFFTNVIVQPIFNLLVFIYAILPGHNLGLAIILFTIAVRLLMWPLIRKQLHNAKAMRALQPELRRIKQESKGDRTKQQLMIMELYKERGISPFGSIGLLIVQLPILIGLYSGLNRVIKDPRQMVDFAYPFLRDLGGIKELAADIGKLDQTLFGIVDLTKPALTGNSVYWPAMIIVIASAVTQYFQSKQLMPADKQARRLRDILKDAGQGKEADQAEVNAAVGRSTSYFIPFLVLMFTIRIPSALGLYWLVSGLVAIIQQWRVLNQDEAEMESAMNRAAPEPKPGAARVIEGEVIEKTPAKPKQRRRKGSKVPPKKNKRRR